MPTEQTLELWEQELRHGHLRLRDAPAGMTIEVEGLLLTSAFSPVFSRAHGRTVGHRAHIDVLPTHPSTNAAAAREELGRRDLLGRTAALAPGLHMSNYRSLVAEPGWLFLDVPGLAVNQTGLWPPLPQDLFSSTLYAPKDVVLDVSVDSANIGQLKDFTRYHEALGFTVALSDFGRQHADLAAVWQIHPDLVSIPLRAVGAPATRNEGRALAALCRVLHESGAMVALSGIDSESDLQQALRTEADLFEGEYAAHSATIQAMPLSDTAVTEPRAALEAGMDAIAAGSTFESACERLLNDPGVLRCYLLDAAGTQLTDNLSPVGVRSDPRYWPLANAVGASWSHREYFRSALAHRGQVMRTGPYFSLPDGRHCLTLSIAGEVGDQCLVLCCDLAETATP
ncbi:MAG: EAL domain-containing protein [Gammaproteobacteria bacterium]|nr:MAG: EAL domain-containing protein [Gammaproteobacteria bacterium]